MGTLVKVAKKPLAQAFGSALRKLRLAKGLSQEKLAHAAETNQAYISLLEKGIRSPSLITLDLLAHALGLKMSALVEQVEREVRAKE